MTEQAKPSKQTTHADGTSAHEADKALAEKTTEITRITQEDFLAQLALILEQYDTDKDGLLSDEDWGRVEADMALSRVS